VKFTFPHKPSQSASRRPSWRDYQTQLKRRGPGRHGRWLLSGAATLAVLLLVVLWVHTRTPEGGKPSAASSGPAQAAVAPSATALLSKADVRDLLGDRPAADLLKKRTFVRWGDRKLTVDSSIDETLQQYLTKRLYAKTSRYIAIVAMEAATGRIVALVGFDKNEPEQNPCLSSRFPAASVFKIVTAGAAIEHCNLSSSSTLTYNGAKHTLYKSQITNVDNRYTHRTTLAASFAQSVNPVFGKLGRHCLGREAIVAYADAFGFNRPIPFELPLAASRAVVTEEPYQWAEVASGFNRSTLLSPLHGALIAAVPANAGLLVEPSIVDRIVGPEGRVLYRARQQNATRAVAPRTAQEVARLMQETVRKGTARKIFRRRSKDPVLSQLVIGGKTGSIDNTGHDARLDWFVGFARREGDQEALAVSVVVAHENYIGRRAGEYARMAMKEYFRTRLGGGKPS
jgi:cell division protein FtsI/penicillin-binding protein 2